VTVVDLAVLVLGGVAVERLAAIIPTPNTRIHASHPPQHAVAPSKGVCRGGVHLCHSLGVPLSHPTSIFGIPLWPTNEYASVCEERKSGGVGGHRAVFVGVAVTL